MALSLMPSNITDRNLASAASINMLKADYNLWMYKVRNGGQTNLDAASTAITAVLANSMVWKKVSLLFLKMKWEKRLFSHGVISRIVYGRLSS